MSSKKHKENVDWILAITGTVNPYNRSGQNVKSEFYLYQMGFLASYLASLMEEDPFVARRFKKHVESKQRPRPRV